MPKNLQPTTYNLDVSPEQSQRAYLNILEDMQAEQKNMDEQRIATFNIMEDITEAQNVLQKRYTELDTLKNLVQKLGDSLETTVVLDTLIQALVQILPASTNLTYVIPSNDPGMSSNLIYVHATAPLSLDYLNEVKENLMLSFDLLPTNVKRREELVEWIHGKFIFEFVEGAQDGVEKAQPLSFFNIPLLVNNEMLGVVNVSSQNLGLFTKQDIDLANTMVGVTANTISRLRQLLDSEQSRVQSLVKSLSNGVIMFDLDKKVTMSNPAIQSMTGLPEKGFYLSEFTKLFTSAAAAAAAADRDLLASFEDNIIKTLETGQVTHIAEARISRFSYEVFVSPIQDLKKDIVGGAIILHDITHLKEIEKMKTEFVSVASHQLRTPLTAINWYVEMLLGGDAGVLNEEQKEFMGEIARGSKRMVRLVGDLLNVSRLETGRLKIEPEPTDLVLFIKDIIKELEPYAGANNCSVEFKESLKNIPKIGIDVTLIRQVVHNLVTNAIRYSKNAHAGKVVVELGKDDAGDYLISVMDNGIGIPKDVQPRIFEKFFRADNAQVAAAEGSGLGLYLVKMIVEASGGKVWFKSLEGKGTTFYLTISASGVKAREGEKGLSLVSDEGSVAKVKDVNGNGEKKDDPA